MAKDTADWTETPADRERALVVASKNRGVPMSLAEVAAQAQARGRAAISSGTSAPVAERKGPAPKTLVEVHQELAEKKKKETKGKAEWEGKHPWKVRSRSTNPNPNPTLTVTGTVTLTLTVTLTTNPDPNPNRGSRGTARRTWRCAWARARRMCSTTRSWARSATASAAARGRRHLFERWFWQGASTVPVQ